MNLIFIVLDSLRQDHVSIYNEGKEIFPGIPPCKTPNIDKFAKDCIIFENVYPCGLPTIPVRYELMTGHFSLPYRGWCPLTEYDLTIADILKREGYISAIISDTYHFRAPGMNYHRSFSVYQWIRGQEYDPHKVAVSKRKIEDYVNENYPEHWRKRIMQFLANTDDLDEKTWFTAEVVDKSVEFLKKARDFKKVFLWLDSFEPHEPWDPPERFDIYTDKNYKGPRLIMPMGGEARKWATEEQINFIRGLYAGEVSFVDYCLGYLFENFEKLGYYEDSLIVLTADHGHPLCDHGKFLKGPDRMYSELLKVPFLIRMPDGKYGGKRVKSLIQFPDVLPTLLEIMGYKNENIPLGGKSFYNVIKGEEEHREAIISGYKGGIYRCIRDKKWSLVITPENEVDMLFDLENDPKERENLIDKYPEVAIELNKKFGNTFKDVVPKFIKGLQGEYEMESASID
ncbi:MAG TPA: sulfatase [bacterium]|nr:sulfatase [bacterium]